MTRQRVDDEKVRQRRIELGTPTMDAFDAALTATPQSFLMDLRDDLAAATAGFLRLTTLLATKCGTDAPPSSNIRNALAACSHTITSLTRDALAPPGSPMAAGASAANGIGGALPAGLASVSGFATRQEALNAILRAAKFFRDCEPHSPISYALEQIFRWGRKSFPDLIADLVEESAAREQLFRLVGISPDQGSKSAD